MDSVLRDLRFAFRLMRKAPVLSIATIVTLGLGIGLNAGVFTVLSGLLLRPRVTLEPDRFVHLQPDYSGTSVPRHESAALSTRDYLAVRDRATTLHPVAAWAVRNTQIGTDAPFKELTMLVSCGFFDVYGLEHLERGRAFRDDECGDRQVPVAVIADEFWTRRFERDPGILGRPLVVNGQAFTIVGVAPPGFSGRLRGEGVWLPYAWEPIATAGASMFRDPGTAWLWVEGRLKPGATRAAAVSELNVILRQQDTLQPGRVTAVTVNNGALIHEPAVRPVAMFLIPLVLGSVGLVLLIACGNVTLLLLSRAVARQREIAIRLAIGCGRGRLTRMLLTESVLLAALGMPLSLWLAWQAPHVMRRLAPLMPQYPMDPDLPVLAALVAASLVAGLTAGLAPALESLRQRITPQLTGEGGLRIGRRRGIRDVLIAAQIGMSFVLLAGTVLFLRAERAIALRDPAVDAAHVMQVSYEPTRESHETLLAGLSSRLRQLPGVHGIAYAGSPGEGFGPQPSLVVQGRARETARAVPITAVTGSYFAIMHQPLLQGRGFASDTTDASRLTARPLVISDAVARLWWPQGGAIGARLESADGRRFDVVGVVHADVPFSAGTADSIEAFELASPAPERGYLYVRFDGDAVALQATIRTVVQNLTPNAALPITLAAADTAQASLFMPMVEMVGSLGITAIVLALVGVYGVVAFAVGRRTREIGVRMALGATRTDIVRMVVSSATPPVVAGLGVGFVLLVPALIALTRVFRFTPVPLHTSDPVPYLIVLSGLVVVSVVTMMIPARRASTVPPSEALRID
jgi:predicted permease